MKKFILFILILLLLILSACVETTKGTDDPSVLPGVRNKDVFFTFVDVDLNHYEYANGIFYKMYNAYAISKGEKFFDRNGQAINPEVRTLTLEKTVSHYTYDGIYFTNKKVEKITVDIIKNGRDTIIREHAPNLSSSENKIHYIAPEFALIKFSDNIYKFDFASETLVDFINGEYNGIIYRRFSVSEKYSYNKIWNFETEWANFISISDNGEHMVFSRMNDVEAGTEVYDNYDKYIHKNILTGEETEFAEKAIMVLGWNGDYLYYQEANTRDFAMSTQNEIIERNCRTGTKTVLSKGYSSFIQTNQYINLFKYARYWDITFLSNTMTIYNRIKDYEFSVVLADEDKAIIPRLLGKSYDEKYFIVSWSEQNSGSYETQLRFVDYGQSFSADDRIACSFTLPAVINSCVWRDENIAAMISDRGTYLIDLRLLNK